MISERSRVPVAILSCALLTLSIAVAGCGGDEEGSSETVASAETSTTAQDAEAAILDTVSQFSAAQDAADSATACSFVTEDFYLNVEPTAADEITSCDQAVTFGNAFVPVIEGQPRVKRVDGTEAEVSASAPLGDFVILLENVDGRWLISDVEG